MVNIIQPAGIVSDPKKILLELAGQHQLSELLPLAVRRLAESPSAALDVEHDPPRAALDDQPIVWVIGGKTLAHRTLSRRDTLATSTMPIPGSSFGS